MTRNKSAVDAIISREEVVEVLDQELILKLPSAEIIAEVRALASQSASCVKEDGSGDMSEGITLFTSAQIKGIAGCLDVGEDTASQLLAVTGGDSGELAVAVRSLLGLSPPTDEEPEAEVTSPLSPSDLEQGEH